MDNTTLDGNAAGGILREIFPFEMTLVEETCAHCSTTRVVGELTVYMSAMGTVMRCPTCDNVLMRIVSTKGGCVSCISKQSPDTFTCPPGATLIRKT